MKSPFIIAIVGFTLSVMAQETAPSLIPRPQNLETGEGTFQLTDQTVVRFTPATRAEADVLAGQLSRLTGGTNRIVAARLRVFHPSEIHLLMDPDTPESESYTLSVVPERITLMGADEAGVFYGTQTLLQLIPTDAPLDIPACTIEDSPRFSWRGLHLDVGRHLFEIEQIKSLLDWMAFHKLNTFHWHLTEDQGWRIEIRKYPKLTQVGAWRDSTPPYGDRKGSDGRRYGGFYTQAQIRDLVAYAADRYITVVPEIDMPGHMSAAITAYPSLGNDDVTDYEPRVQTRWGVHPYVLAPKEETFEWIDDVLTELCELFPSAYIHIGGDEAPKEQWKESEFAQSVMKREGLTDEYALQSYFIKRVEEILKKKGRRLIGWDEIREGGLSPNATVMCWRGNGIESAVASAVEGHDVVMTPNSHTYLDHYQRPAREELSKGVEFEAIGGFLPLRKLYTFEPVPAKLDRSTRQHVLGVQGQLWTEYMHDWDKVEYMAFPRVAALAELGWTQPELKDYESFRKRLAPFLERYRDAGIDCAEPYDSTE